MNNCVKAMAVRSLLLLWALCSATLAHGGDSTGPSFEPELMVYEQTDERRSPLDVANVPTLKQAFGFEDWLSSTNKGYSYTPHWVLIPLRGAYQALGNDQPLWLAYGYPLVDSIAVYFLQQGKWVLAARTGDQHSWKTRSRHAPEFYFPIPPDSPYALVRLQTIGSLQFPFSVYRDSGLETQLYDQGIAHGLFFGALIIMIFYNLFVFLMAREVAYLYYVILISAISLFQLAVMGYASMYLWRDDPGWFNAHIQPITIGICLTFVTLFTRNMLNVSGISTKLDRLLLMESGLSACMALGGFFASYTWMVRITSIWPLLVVVTVIAVGVVAVIKRQSGAWIFVAAWGAGLVGAVLFSAQQQGWLPANEITIGSLKLGIVLNVVLLSFSLASHIRQLRREKENFEKEARHNYELALVDGLTGVPNRRAFDERLGQEIDRARRDRRNIALLMIDIDYFKNFNDAYGHQQGDDTLVRTALIMRNCLRRPSDTLFRYGGEEFSVILPDTDEEGARYTADRVMSAIRKLCIPHSESPFKQITVSIGAAVAKNANIEAEDFIQIADQALYQAKRKGRNTLILTEQRDNPVVNIGDYFKNTPKDTL